VLATMVALFLFGQDIPADIVPPAAAVIAAALALLVVQVSRFEPVGDVLRDIDWKTLLFIMLLFGLVEAFTRTGLLQSFSQMLYDTFGTRLLVVAMIVIAGIGFASSLLANVPIVAGMLITVKGYLILTGLVPDQALDPTFTAWPVETLPLFVAMMFGGTLGGNATLIGAGANIVSVGICAANGKRVSFVGFMRYGVPVVIVQLTISALYVLGMHFVLGR
jgi:Na+/H+ antiporter NhaD/arsenite permease-like protein